jgi:hypothetical protein
MPSLTGNKPNQVPLNADLGNLAYQNASSIAGPVTVGGSVTANVVVSDTISEETAAAGVTVDGVLLKDSQVSTDQINEKTNAAGVTIDGVLLKDSEVTTDVINEKTSATGVTIDGVLLKDSQVTTDQINEKTSAAGVTIDSVLLKDNKVTANELTINSNNISADNSLGFRNRIINGDMRIDQRNAGAAVTVTNSFPVDRFNMQNSTDGAFSAQQDSSVPAGFNSSLKISITTADASVTTTQLILVRQLIEGNNVADLGWGTANAKTVTLSFWVRSSLTGTFGGALRNNDATRSYPFTYSISAADTWEQKSVTIAGDTSGTWLKDTGNGIGVNWSLGAGPDRSGTAGAWNSNNNTSATGAVSVIGTLNATWYITGVQLEVGSVATPFERRDYGTELQLCQRYFFKTFGGSTKPDQNVGTAGSYVMPQVVGASTTQNGITVSLPVAMRAQTTITTYNPSAANAQVRNTSVNADCTNTGITSIGNQGYFWGIAPFCTNAAGSAAGNQLRVHITIDGEL